MNSSTGSNWGHELQDLAQSSMNDSHGETALVTLDPSNGQIRVKKIRVTKNTICVEYTRTFCHFWKVNPQHAKFVWIVSISNLFLHPMFPNFRVSKCLQATGGYPPCTEKPCRSRPRTTSGARMWRAPTRKRPFFCSPVTDLDVNGSWPAAQPQILWVRSICWVIPSKPPPQTN